MYRVLIDGNVMSPRWNDSTAFVYEREGDNIFLRAKLTGTFIFQRGDYDNLMALFSMYHLFTFILQNNDSGSWVVEWTGEFMHLDMVVDQDNRTLRVKPKPVDTYSRILANLDREFNITELSPPTVSVEFEVLPLIQIYVLDSGILNNYIGGTYWETPVEQPTNGTFGFFNIDYAEFGFGIIDSMVAIWVTGVGASLSPDISGRWVYDGSGTHRSQSLQYETLWQNYDGGNRWTIIDTLAGDAVVYAGEIGKTLLTGYPNYGSDPLQTNRAILTSISDPLSTCEMSLAVCYGRALTNETTFNGVAAIDILADDIAPPNANYTKAAPLEVVTLIGGDNHQTGVEELGKIHVDAANFGGEYFGEKTGLGHQTYPVIRSAWTSCSWWFYMFSALQDAQEDEGTTYIMQHCYRLPDVINAILGEISGTITHEDTDDFSDFFYGAANPIKTPQTMPIITQKSNAVKGIYDKPARKAPIKLGQIFDFLRQFYNVYWYIEDDKLKLEHISYFENGKDYVTPQIDADLTTLIEPQTGDPWATGTLKWKYEKQKLPEQIRFAWMDQDVSEPFQGYPIEMSTIYGQSGNFEDKSAGVFTSDIDYLKANPDNISLDGFLWMEATESAGVFTLPFVLFTQRTNHEYRMQNGYASLLWMHDKYFRHDLPVPSVEINGQATTATTTRRLRITEFRYPEIITDPLKLITAGLGDGQVVAMERKLSGETKLTTRHDTE